MKLYFRYFSIHVRSIMQYKVSFFMTAFGQFLVAFTGFISIAFMFDRFHEVQGFQYSEVLLCFSVVLMAFSLSETFFRGFDAFPSMISNGEFDRILVRPRNEIFQVLCSKLELTRLSRVLQAAITLCWAIPASNIDWTPSKVAVLVLMIVGGIANFSGLFLIYAAISFFTLEGLEFMNIFTDGGREFGRYPYSVYGRSVLKFFTFVIPSACFQYYPFTYLIGRTNQIWAALTPLYCFVFLIPCWMLWRFGVRHYRSTGS